MEYVIVGNGILAFATAFRLTQRLNGSDHITVIGPSERPGSATLAAAAMLNSFGEINCHSLKSDFDLYHFELSHLATRKWPEFERELITAAGDNLPYGCKQCQIFSGGCFDRGTYIINNPTSDELDDKNFDAILQALKNFDEPFEIVCPRDIPNYHPAQRARALRALYIHNEGWLNPRLVLEKIEAILANSACVTLVDEKAARFIHSGDRISAVELANGRVIEGDEFLLSAGASCTGILSNSKIELPIQPVFYGVGVSLQVKSPSHPHQKCIRTPNRGNACGIYTVPYFIAPDQPRDDIMIGASNRIAETPSYHGGLGSIERLMKGAIDEINQYFYAAHLMRVNVGWRPTTQDTYPLLGRTSIENLAIATGTKRDGFHLSPVISDLMASILMNQPVDPRFEMFAPERAVIRDLARADAVEIIVASIMSAQYQHGYSPSDVVMDNSVREMYRRQIEELHDRVGAKDWGIPPELVKMYREGHARV